jgi:hypothetical protein
MAPKRCRKTWREAYLLANKDKIAKKQAAWNRKNKAKVKEYRNGRKYEFLRDTAKRHGKEFSITREEYGRIRKQLCRYCNGELPNFGGVDRINNNRGYVSGNCGPCCRTCNVAKNSMSVRAFYIWIRRVAVNLGYMEQL